VQELTTRLRPGERVRVRDAVWRVERLQPYRACVAIELTALDRAGSPPACTLLWPFDRPVRLARPARPRLVGRRRAIRAVAGALLESTPWGSLGAATDAAIEIYPYQLEPALAFVRGLAARVLLADEVGLGKTIQAGLVLRELERAGELARALVLVPPGLRDQWADELHRRFQVPATIVDAASLRQASAALPRGVNPWAWHRVLVTSIDFVKRPAVLRSLEALVWDLVVVDEAHLVAGVSDRRRAVAGLAARARRVLLLTATPHGGDERAFDALCDLGRLGARADDPLVFFRRTRRALGLARPRRTRRLVVHPTAREARAHRLLERYTEVVWREAAARHDRAALLAMLVLRKRALSSAGSLADSAERRLAALGARAQGVADQPGLPFDTGGETDTEDLVPDAVLAAPGLANGEREQVWLRAIAAAARRAEAHESKTARLVRLLRRTREPVVVFTEYRDTLERLARAVGCVARVAVLHGGLGRAERAAALAAFASGEARVLLATDAAGQGLNLHARCRWVVTFELPWSPARLEQRIGRVDRLGQRRPVHATLLVAAGTAERLVIANLVARAARSRAALGEPAGAALGFPEFDLARSLMGSAHPAPPPPAPRRFVRPPGLARDARREAQRVIDLRHLLQALGSPPEGGALGAPVVAFLGRRGLRRARRRGLSTRRLLLVYAATLEDATGRPADTRLFPIVVSLADTMKRLEPSREAMAAVLAAAARAIDHRVRADLAARRRFVAPRHRRAIDLSLRREQRLRRAVGRALAAELVLQPGLFDRRALRRGETSRLAATLTLDAVDRRLKTLAERRALEVGDVQLVAGVELAKSAEEGS
jgi:superfamily II DNA or RNA helicase